MKKLLNLFGIFSLSTVNLFQNSWLVNQKENIKISNKINKKDTKSSCDCSDVITSYKEFIAYSNRYLTSRVSQLTLDEWTLNFLYNAFNANSKLDYSDIEKFLSNSILDFSYSTNTKAKEVISKAIISHGFKYVNNQVGGVFIKVEEIKYNEVSLEENWLVNSIQVGVFDSTKRQPLEQEIYSDIKFSKAFNLSEPFKKKTVETQGLMSYHSIPRFGFDIWNFKEKFNYISFPDAEMQGILIDQNNQIYKKYNYSRIFNGSDPQQLLKTYDIDVRNPDEEEYYLNAQLYQDFYYEELFPSMFLINETDVKLIFRQNSEFKYKYDILVENTHNFQNNFSFFEETSMTFNFKLNDKIAFFNSVELSEIENLYNKKISDKELNFVNERIFPPIGGSPFLTRIIYEDFGGGYWGIEIYLNREALNALANMLCIGSDHNTPLINIVRELLMLAAPQFFEYTIEEQNLIVNQINAAIRNRYNNHPNYLWSFFNEFYYNEEATFGVSIQAMNFENDDPSDIDYEIDIWNYPPHD
ncbi:hypothetical protein [Spiroplasma cantharicola]|uniref:Uncharacterized protein n=1 Tax=Spiroplasma cantharicola TaxID=362837 RepID=A0A0M3SJE2_9MOLU|nr:hypothetical protein [Spiroplasma cantharicola]ALD66598.1 hypothetical protein SCANT_v1c06920 [Spiroplasma cantharicola]